MPQSEFSESCVTTHLSLKEAAKLFLKFYRRNVPVSQHLHQHMALSSSLCRSSQQARGANLLVFLCLCVCANMHLCVHACVSVYVEARGVAPQVRPTAFSELDWPASLRDPLVCAPQGRISMEHHDAGCTQVTNKERQALHQLSPLPGAAWSDGLNVCLWVHNGVEHVVCAIGHSNALFKEMCIHFYCHFLTALFVFLSLIN